MRIGQIWRAPDMPDGHFVLICGIDDSAGKEVVHEHVPTRRGMVTVAVCTKSGEQVGRKFIWVPPSCFGGTAYSLVG